jgi:hypothetical protein
VTENISRRIQICMGNLRIILCEGPDQKSLLHLKAGKFLEWRKEMGLST